MSPFEFQLRSKGYAVWTRPGISLEDNERAQQVSALEAHFLRRLAGTAHTFYNYAPGPAIIIGNQHGLLSVRAWR